VKASGRFGGFKGDPMKAQISAFLALIAASMPSAAAPQTPFSGETEPGVPFPLKQMIDHTTGRRVGIGESNALTVAWDGRLLLYIDVGSSNWGGAPAGTIAQGFIFATFDPEAVVVDPQTGRPDFGNCIGTEYPRFAAVSDFTPTNVGNDYPSYPGYTGGPYPFIPATAQGVGSMGELGLHHTEHLSDNMYPVPIAELPAGANGHNPYRSDSTGQPQVNGAYKTYRMVLTLQDIPKFWDLIDQKWAGYDPNDTDPFLTTYQPGTYPNGFTVSGTGPTILINGRCKLEVVVDPAAQTVEEVEVLEKWRPFKIVGDGTYVDKPAMAPQVGLSLPSTSTMWASNFEPTLSNDGHLMVGKGFTNFVNPSGTSRVVFYYNQDAFALDGWQGPWELHHLYLKRGTALGADGRTIAERYPISRHPIKEYDGKVLGDFVPGIGNGDGDLSQAEADASTFEGGYTWFDPDGRFLFYTVYSGGVGSGHPECVAFSPHDGGGGSNRGHPSIVGSVTGWQMWRIDHEAENPGRHMFTAWDQDSRTTHQRVASFGFTPGFWEMLSGAPGLPLRRDGGMRLQLVNSQRLLYYEIDLSPYQERDYAFYLPMQEMLVLQPNAHREVDILRTPDFSGRGNVGHVTGAQLPCEYFDLPTNINTTQYGSMPGLYTPAAAPNQIHPSWTSADTVQGGHGGHWAPLADWKDGKDTNNDGSPDTQPFAGRGNARDMDSDACWGRVGQAMFFKETTRVRVQNFGTSRPELHPGTGMSGAADEFTAALWVHPLQARTGNATIFAHHFSIVLTQAGGIDASVSPAAGGQVWLQSPTGVAVLEDWTHVALTWKDLPGANTSEMRLYIDGDEVPNSPVQVNADTLAQSSLHVRMGCLESVASDASKAVLLLDEVALKNSALTEPQVANLALAPIVEPLWDPAGPPLPAAPLPFVNADDARIPVNNPYSIAEADLGADLFRDVQLSIDKSMSCAACHDPARAFTEDLAVTTGLGGVPLLRNTPSIYNQRFEIRQFWDARAANLEDQALDPVFDVDEMGLDWTAVDAYLENDADYNARFAALGAADITEEDVRRALATYMRVPTAGASPVDLFENGTGSLTAAELRGRALFRGKAHCSGCHSGPNFTDGRLWTTGTFRDDHHDDGAFNADASPATAGRARFLGAFKTPSLRELTRTGPYFHDGHAATLQDVVDFYNAGGVRQDGQGHALLDPVHDVVAEETNRKLGLSDQEIDDLVLYLEALAGTDVNDGPVGLNKVPTAVITSVKTLSSGGGGTSLSVTTEVTDMDGAADLDVAMDWTLEVEFNGATHNWSDATVSSIPNGYRAIVVVSPAPPFGTPISARAADHHGRWSPLDVW
jgi:cytochrome c peroxidase